MNNKLRLIKLLLRIDMIKSMLDFYRRAQESTLPKSHDIVQNGKTLLQYSDNDVRECIDQLTKDLKAELAVLITEADSISYPNYGFMMSRSLAEES